MKTSGIFFFHGLGLAWYAYLVYAISLITKKNVEKPSDVLAYGGQWKFLTVLNLAFQAVFYGVSMLTDAFVLMKKHRIAKSMFFFRDLLFGGLAFPLSMFVFTSFWMLYSYDRELVYPKSLDLVFPVWMNHAMHTAIFPLTMLDLFSTPRRYPSKGKGLSLLGIGGFSYLCWVLWIYSVTGKWVYPVFEVLSPLAIAGFFLGSFIILLIMYNTGEFFCRMIWGDSIVILDIYKKKSK
uniref:Androgen dependent TFPI regulating protein n=1 Tax=Anolis carolinensis TaxID=28377 RepID=A0A803TJI8_ANOCA|nr:PREDICTED: androgen-dependent TFPI-regulating protein [Anolis carolinensis]|eukprot:XP_003223614.1 PREDICTED: androgen-dependent TFPI-regulating protein [Anolis carolinensis]